MRDFDFFLRDFAPATTHLAFFELPAPQLTQILLSRSIELNARNEFPWTVTCEELKATFRDKLERLLPLTAPVDTKLLISSTDSGWCSYIPNGRMGGDVHSQPDYLSGILKVRSISVVLVPDEPGGKPGSVQFVYRDGAAAKPVETVHGTQYRYPMRVVMAHKESKWEFHAHGDPLPFEELGQYEARRIKDRLTPEMIERYCAALGIQLFDPDFYAGYGSVIHKYSPPNTIRLERFPNA